MAIFGRKKKETVDAVEEETEQVVLEGEPGVDRDWDRAFDGPHDVSERPEATGLVNLGAVKVPAVPGMEMRLDLEKGTNRITGVTCTIGGSKLQVQAFAAPRSEGLWDEIREGLVEGIKAAGGSAQVDPDGVMGKELLARMPGRDANGRVAFAPNRFIGVDGPRWFVRAVINGPAASDAKQLAVVRTFLRRVVVDRGTEARPPREVLTLTPPQSVVEEAARRRKAAQEAAAEKKAAEAQAAAGGSDAPSSDGTGQTDR
ncbi:DUF3710 domain-containing protein [Ornithinimicrobium faecis]|uniref:DUF3710 domain-containing protein n=1 Tax=Ornithinimicrobium faecis TaxID=2934158 RepID=A0ABY4YYA3_9MICO|nr:MULTISPECIES: DUF3710 domain-containing protein [unclassified Ornithinimicrobium]USQ81761.1 DUF3710 domain-containing protein [Ornithinimicrobium sp. HY1793]